MEQDDFVMHEADGADKKDFEVIVLKKEKTEPAELTEKERKSNDLSAEARKTFSKMAEEAKTIEDYLRAFRGIFRYGKAQFVEWMFDYGDVSLETLFEEMEDGVTRADIAKDAEAVQKLKGELEQLPPKDGFVRVGLKRIRSKNDNSVSGYRVLAIFPKGAEVVQDAIDKKVTDTAEDTRIVFFKPANACVLHACDDVYRSTPEGSGRGMLYIPLKTYSEVASDVRTSGGVAEYMEGNAQDGKKITQDSENYLTLALMGGFSNEENRVIVSDYYLKSY